jgi:hypothetical protein
MMSGDLRLDAACETRLTEFLNRRDRINRETIEDIAKRCGRAVQGPQQLLSRLSKLRHLPDGLLSTPARKARKANHK